MVYRETVQRWSELGGVYGYGHRALGVIEDGAEVQLGVPLEVHFEAVDLQIQLLVYLSTIS